MLHSLRVTARLLGSVGEVTADGQGVRVLGAEHPLGDGQQSGVLVMGSGRIPGLPGPVGQAGAGGQGAGVLGAKGCLLYTSPSPRDRG